MKKIWYIAPFFVVLMLNFTFTPLAKAALKGNNTHYWQLDESVNGAAAADAVNASLALTNTKMQKITGIINNGTTATTTGHFFHNGTEAMAGTFTPFTINFWTRINVGPQTQSYGLFYNQSADQVGFDYSHNDDVAGQTVLFFSMATETGTNLSFQKILATSTWHMITAVYDGTTKYIYLDSVNSASNAVGTWTTSGNALGTTLANTSAGTRPANFDLDEVGVWTRALTQQEINELYNAGVGCQYPFGACESFSLGEF